MVLQATLCLVTAALVINFWLGWRCAQVRSDAKISIGDGGNDRLQRRMRAQANFIEQVPLTLLLYALVELTGHAPGWLVWLGALFLLGRIAHAFGMEGALSQGRMIGMATGMVLQVALAIMAILAALGRL